MSSEKKKEDAKPSNKGKAHDPDRAEKVCSANSWESADLGDDERKKKFLKLMGASKKEHHGRFVIGNQEPVNVHTRAKTETDAVNKELEDQYKHSYEHKITRRHHKGLGFTEEDNKLEDSSETDKEGRQSGEGTEAKGENSETAKESQTEKIEKKRESTESSDKNSSAPKKPKMMAFVKSSESV